MNEFTKFQVNMPKKRTRFAILDVKKATFYPIYGNFSIFPIFTFPVFGWFKKCSGVIFRVVDENPT